MTKRSLHCRVQETNVLRTLCGTEVTDTKEKNQINTCVLSCCIAVAAELNCKVLTSLAFSPSQSLELTGNGMLAAPQPAVDVNKGLRHCGAVEQTRKFTMEATNLISFQSTVQVVLRGRVV